MANHNHLRWKRLSDERVVPKRKGFGGSKPPLHLDQRAHGDDLLRKLKVVETRAADARVSLGIDTNHLRILQFDFLEGSSDVQRNLLENQFGAYLIEQQDTDVPINPPYFTVEVTFFATRSFEQFLELTFEQLSQFSISSIERVRTSSGESSPLRLNVCFTSKDSGKAFIENTNAHQSLALKLSFPKMKDPIICSKKRIHRFVAQFPDSASIAKFEAEMQAYISQRQNRENLTQIQRNELFDALSNIDLLTKYIVN